MPSTEAHAASAPPTASSASEGAHAPSSRDLAADSSFGDIVSTARSLDDAGRGSSDAGCLVGARTGAWRLEADLLAAVRPLPDAEPDLAPRLAHAAGRVRVLTPWGQLGDGPGGPALAEVPFASFTTVAPDAARAPSVLMALTHAGVFLRYGDRAATSEDGPLALDAAIARLATVPAHAVYLSADGDTPVPALHSVLARLDGRTVAFAVALPSGTRLPDVAPPPATNSTVHMCPGGLPDPDPGATEGALDHAAIVGALAPLREGALRCLERTLGSARAGGTFTLALRIGPDGRVRHACALDDDLHDPALAACVVGAARDLSFPPPAPAGFVDAHLPLRLAPLVPAAQRSVCP